MAVAAHPSQASRRALSAAELEAVGEQAALRACSAVEAWESARGPAGGRAGRAAAERAARDAHCQLGALGRELLRRRASVIREVVTSVLAAEGVAGLEVMAWPWRAPHMGRARCLGAPAAGASRRAVEDVCLMAPVWAWASVVDTVDHRGLLGARIRLTADGMEVLERLPVLQEALSIDVPVWMATVEDSRSKD